jgi:hypothetical protein
MAVRAFDDRWHAQDRSYVLWLAGAVAAAALAASSIGSAATVMTVKGTVDPGFRACPRRTVERIGPCLP